VRVACGGRERKKKAEERDHIVLLLVLRFSAENATGGDLAVVTQALHRGENLKDQVKSDQAGGRGE
jgi:hypothetical protein